MTREEAIEKLKYCKSVHNGSFGAALKIAIKAVKKTIPQQVDLDGDGYDPDGNLVYDMAYCPNPDCGQEFEESDENWECNYCPNCGQALNWWGDKEGESTN